MADVRTFRAATMREALDLVRDKLGADAVILHTRQVARKRFLPWRKPIEEVEITATLTYQSAAAAELKRPKRAAGATSKPSRRSSTKPPATQTSHRLDLVSEPSESVAEMLGHAPAAPAPKVTANRWARKRPDDTTNPNPAAPDNRDSTAMPTRKPFSEPRTPTARTNRFTGGQVARSHAGESEEADPTAALTRRLDTIQQMLLELGRNNVVAAPAPNAEIPSELFHLYTELIDSEVEENVARDLIFKLRLSAAQRQLTDVAAAKSVLSALVESEIRCCEPITPRPGRRKVVALVGATGVGKTTTIAKLAANFRLRSEVKMGLVTVDTYRVAAVEQLRTYAEIIDLPMKVVTNPLEMRRALDELTGLDLVLIDTAGRSPKDDLQIQELKLLLAEARVDEVHLVLSMTSSTRSLEAAAAKFGAAGTTAIILTKLDEASGMGGLLSVARRIKLPISYLTAGQDVPDDIEPAHPRRIARLILGQERVTT